MRVSDIIMRQLGYVRSDVARFSENQCRVRQRLLGRTVKPLKLELPVGKKILALSPHPDDEAIGAGGLLLAHRNQAEIHIVSLTDGEKGGALENPPSDPLKAERAMAETRRGEIAKVANTLNVKSLTFCSYPDGALVANDERAAHLRDIVGKIDPDVVILPWFFDDHPDHRQTNLLYAAACEKRDCLVLGCEIWSMIEPTAYFDITDLMAAKLDLVGEYRSQLRTVDYSHYVAALAQIRAFHHPVRENRTGAVEAFVALPNREYCDLVAMAFETAPSAQNGATIK